MTETGRGSRPVSGWAIGGTVFAGVMMLLIGLFHAVAGIVAIFDDEFYVVAANYTFELDVTGWGWIHLIGGIVVALGGFALFSGATWARITGIVLALLSALANFFFLPYYPWWSLLMIALAVWVIWSLSRPIPTD
jgi:tetrahydromethanopterin S-methyltransferase subunit F